MAFILGHSVKGGRRAGFMAMVGTWCGAFLHVLMAALGLSAIIAASAPIFAAVKWAGAAYLIWLGIQAWRSGGHMALEKDMKSTKPSAILRQGFFISALNPKVAIFFLAFLPQFVIQTAGPVWMQLCLHGSLIILVSAFIEPLIIVFGVKLSQILKQKQGFGKWLDRGLGTLFIGLGLSLAFAHK